MPGINLNDIALNDMGLPFRAVAAERIVHVAFGQSLDDYGRLGAVDRKAENIVLLGAEASPVAEDLLEAGLGLASRLYLAHKTLFLIFGV